MPRCGSSRKDRAREFLESLGMFVRAIVSKWSCKVRNKSVALRCKPF